MTTPREAAERLREIYPALLEAAERHWIQPEYDCPGGPPELCGYNCAVCKGFGATDGQICHKAGCVAADARAILGFLGIPLAKEAT